MNLQFKIGSKRQIFWETFHGNFILEREAVAEETISFWEMSDLGFEPWHHI